MENQEFLTKSDVRGKRAPKNHTIKRGHKHQFDDQINEHGTKRGHSRMFGADILSLEDYEDEPYADLIDPKLIR